MPANLPPHYYEEEKKLRTARTPEEKIAILESLLRLMPKHKGTEKLQAELKRRLASARSEGDRRSGGKRKADEHHVPREGAGQVILAGLPNSGKSSIVGALTHASPLIAAYPYATLKPLSGMARYENVMVQLVDIPPIPWEVTDPWVSNLLRNADAICLTVELQDDPVGQTEILLEEISRRRILPLRRGEEAPAEPGALLPRRVFLAGTKRDLPGAEEGLQALESRFSPAYGVVGFSAAVKSGTELFLRETFRALDRVRIYSKVQGKKPDREHPFVVRKGTTVYELAGGIHKDFLKQFRAARIFSQDGYDGQRVGKDFMLRDGDVIEILV